MTKRQAKQYACAWVAADLTSHDAQRFCDDEEDNQRVWIAYREIITEMVRRGSDYSDETDIGPHRNQQFHLEHEERRG